MAFAATTLRQIAAAVGGDIEGDPDLEIRGVAGLQDACKGDLSFLSNPKYADDLGRTAASAVIVNAEIKGAPCALLRVGNPDLAFARAVEEIADPEPSLPPSEVHPSACVAGGAEVDPTASVGANVTVEPGARIGGGTRLWPGVYVGHDAVIGSGCDLRPGAVVCHGCRLGNRVILHAGAVIGSDGFGYAWDGRQHVKIRQVGIVIVEDDVEIGANTTVDRARFGATVIGAGTKLDNLIQIAHNVRVGPLCAFAAQVGVAGSTHIGAGCLVGGQVGILGHLDLADGVRLSAMAGVTKSLGEAAQYTGYPARPHRQQLEEWRHVKALGRLRRTVRELEERIKDLEAQTADD